MIGCISRWLSCALVAMMLVLTACWATGEGRRSTQEERSLTKDVVSIVVDSGLLSEEQAKAVKKIADEVVNQSGKEPQDWKLIGTSILTLGLNHLSETMRRKKRHKKGVPVEAVRGLDVVVESKVAKATGRAPSG